MGDRAPVAATPVATGRAVRAPPGPGALRAGPGHCGPPLRARGTAPAHSSGPQRRTNRAETPATLRSPAAASRRESPVKFT